MLVALMARCAKTWSSCADARSTGPLPAASDEDVSTDATKTRVVRGRLFEAEAGNLFHVVF